MFKKEVIIYVIERNCQLKNLIKIIKEKRFLHFMVSHCFILLSHKCVAFSYIHKDPSHF